MNEESFKSWLFEQYMAGREDSVGDFANACFDEHNEEAKALDTTHIEAWNKLSGYHSGFKMAVKCWRLTLQDRAETLTDNEVWGGDQSHDVKECG